VHKLAKLEHEITSSVSCSAEGRGIPREFQVEGLERYCGVPHRRCSYIRVNYKFVEKDVEPGSTSVSLESDIHIIYIYDVSGDKRTSGHDHLA
jgi:hypothetical protein